MGECYRRLPTGLLFWGKISQPWGGIGKPKKEEVIVEEVDDEELGDLDPCERGLCGVTQERRERGPAGCSLGWG